MRNNNSAVVRKLTKRSLKSNGKRNIFIVTAIALTTLMLTSVFSVGMSFLESERMQQMRLMGTVAHASLSNPSDSELEMLGNLDYIKATGMGNPVAQIKSNAQMGDMTLGLYYFDEIQWNEMRTPAYTDIAGNYPQREYEIMVPAWVLERLGVSPEIGMEIPFSYTVESDREQIQYDETFILSGWFTSYMHIRSGNVDSVLVSEEFSQRHGKTAQSDGAAIIIFESASKVSEYCRQLEHDLGITDSQRVRAVPMYDISDSDSTATFIALSLIIAFLVLIGYLLIYNVLYISVSRDVRFYGLLKTVGTTPRQIRRIVTGQILRLCAVGIPLGMALASLLSLAVVPALISGMSNIATGTVVSFSPLIYAGAAFFSLLTALLGALMPAKKAAGISPIEAQKYTGTETNKSTVRAFTHGKPYKMALRNIFRDRKRAIVVLLSLFLGITTFITITAVITGMDTDNYAASYVQSDFILRNNTVNVGAEIESKQKFDDALLQAINGIAGLDNMQYDTSGWFRLTYTDAFDAHFSNTFRDEDDIPPESIAAIKENFTCTAVGVDSSALLELDGNFDIEAFDRGEYLLLSVGDPVLYEHIKTVEIGVAFGQEVLGEIPVGGFAPLFFRNDGYSAAPTLIMSNSLMDSLTGGAIRSVLYIDTADGYDTQFLESLKTLTDGDYEISRISRIEAREELRDGKMMLYIFGGGIALVIGMIGILNFVNIMSVGIMVRKREFAALESIGMSRKQMRSMLLCEGAGYAIITLLLVSFVGNAITYGIFKLFQQQATYAVFTYPAIPAAVTALAILAVCIVTPETAYRSINKTPLAERLREAE